MYYNRPVPGRAYRPFKNEMVGVSVEELPSWSFKKLARWKSKDFAIFTNDKNEEIMQSLQAIRFMRCKPGEDNINSKLTNEQGIEIFTRANEGESRQDLAQEFNISPNTVTKIKNLRARVGVSLAYMDGKPKQNPPAGTVAKRNKGAKLSLPLARFIRKDNTQMHMSSKQLASKYCVSQRTIQRILKGDMYKDA